MSEPYKNDLAFIHDAGFGALAESAASVLLDEMKCKGIISGLIIDLGCGSGILAQIVSAAGYDVLGIDISEQMIALARERVPQGQFRTESLLTAELPPSVAVVAIGECFNYLFDRANTTANLFDLFKRVYDSLDHNEVFLFDIAEQGRVPNNGLYRTFTEGEDWAVLMATEEDRERGLLTRQITTFRKIGEFYRRDSETHQLRLLRSLEILNQLRDIGFQVRAVRSYGQLKFPQGLVGFMAHKP